MLHFTSGFQAGRLKEILEKALKRPKKNTKIVPAGQTFLAKSDH